MKTFLSLVVTVALLGGAVWGAWGGIKGMLQTLTEPDDWAGPGTGAVKVTINEGDSGQAIADTLQAAGVVKTSKAFIKAFGQDTRARDIQPGTYQLHRQMSSSGAVELLLDPASRLVRRITVPEGRRVSEVVDLLVSKVGLKKSDLQAALQDPPAIGLPPGAGGHVEGYLFPATYEFQPDTTATEALREMVSHGQKALTRLGVKRNQQHTVLTKASIVQAEGGSVKDFGKVARVVENRLDIGMQLQMDSTVVYGRGTRNLFTTDAERADTGNKWNTYAHKGLPPTPIGNPGEDAIQAVIDPPPGKWLFFVLVNMDTGETKFATTSAEHARNVAEWQAWYRKNRS